MHRAEIENDKLDNFVRQLEVSEPAFFQEYIAARKISQAGSRSSRDKQGTLPLPKAAQGQAAEGPDSPSQQVRYQ